jgi:hypothetical protein
MAESGDMDRLRFGCFSALTPRTAASARTRTPLEAGYMLPGGRFELGLVERPDFRRTFAIRETCWRYP